MQFNSHRGVTAFLALGSALIFAGVAARSSLGAAIELGKTVPVRAETGNRAVAVTIRNAALVDRYGAAKAGEGRLFVILSTQWENVLPVQLTADNKSLPTGYKIPDLREHVYLLIDGKRVARVLADAGKLPGHVQLKDFSLPAMGDVAKGNLIFDVPRDLALQARWMEVRYYDLTHGHFSTLLAGEQASPADKPLAPPQGNEVLQAAVFGVKRLQDYGGKSAPAGMAYIDLDLRAESTFKMPADASAFDPQAKPGTQTQKAVFADWTDWKRYAHLVVDGEYSYTLAGTDLPETPRLIPEAMTGGSMVFLAPAKTRSLQLRLDFPNAKSGARVIRPRALELAIEGSEPSPPKRPALVAIDDDFFRVNVFNQAVSEQFAGAASRAGRFLVLDVQVNNAGKEGEFFQTKQQMKLLGEKGETIELSPATYGGSHPAADLHFVPAQEHRTFQIAYEIPATLARPRLAYAGVSMAKTFELPPLQGGSPVVSSQPAGSQPASGLATASPGGQRPAAGPTTQLADANGVRPVDPSRPVAATPDKKSQLPKRVPASQPAKPQGLAVAGLSAEKVNESIDRGARFLWGLIKDDVQTRRKELHREDILHLLALTHANFHKKDPACESAVRDALQNTDPVAEGIYGAGLYCMLAESFGDGMYLPKVRRAAKYLVESQGKSGSWGYNGNRDPRLYAEPEPDLSQPLSVIGGRPLEGPGSLGEPIKRQGGPDAGEDGDISVTQYAILGLHSAERLGVVAPRETWKKAADMLVGWQQPDGGWGYNGSASYAYGSMTCAGVGTLTLCRFHLGEATPTSDPLLERGIGWLDVKFAVSENPGYDTTWLYYYLYGMERVGRILDTEYLGEHEWYPFGARYLIGKQQSDGSWAHTGQEAEPHVATSFALLFLTRATPTLSVAKKSGPGTLKTEVALPPNNRLYVILDASGSMLEEMGGKTKFQIAQDAVCALIDSLPANSEVALRVYGHRKRAIDKDADLDTQLVVPMAKLDKPKLTAVVRGLRCRGKTPLATSLKQAAQDLAGAKDPAHPITLVLLTDGGEDTIPRQDPVKASLDVAKLGGGVGFQIVGFDINRQDWSDQLQNIAAMGHGQYLPADKAEVLLDRLEAAIYRTPDQFVVTDASGKEVGRGNFGQSLQLAPGKYTVATSLAGLSFQREAWINPLSTTVARFDSVKVDFSQAKKAGPSAGPKAPAAANAPAANAPAANAPVPSASPAAATTTPPGPVPPTPASPPPAAPPAKARFCVQCGKPIPAGAKFCPNCGAKTGS